LLSIILAAGWPAWPLLVCSVLAVALIIERLVALRPSRVLPSQVLEQAMEATRAGLPGPAALAELDRSGALGPILASGLQTLREHPEASHEQVMASMEMAGRVQAHQLERYLTALGTIASAAPLIGLLGTVVGMIEIFGAHQAGASQQPAQLARGISIALYNTAFGLIIAIPALMFWRYFRATVDRYVLLMELASERFAQHLDKIRS
jgi:biopolymer transport protein ExbB